MRGSGPNKKRESQTQALPIAVAEADALRGYLERAYSLWRESALVEKSQAGHTRSVSGQSRQTDWSPALRHARLVWLVTVYGVRKQQNICPARLLSAAFGLKSLVDHLNVGDSSG